MQAIKEILSLPETGFLRLNQIIGDKKKGIPTLIPISKAGWHNGVRAGRFPAPIHLSERVAVYRVEDIRKLIQQPTGGH